MTEALLHHDVDPVGLLQGGAGEVVDLSWQIDHHPVIGIASHFQQRLELLDMHILRQA
ncbi:hypothetical protein D3C84_1072800 [compost metagenome]